MFYINQYCAISSAGIIEPTGDVIDWNNNNHKVLIEPNYIDLIPVMQLRRMTKPIKWGVACIKKMLKDSELANISAINVGTAYGLLTDSESFLNNLVVQNEQMLNPTAFIQSTHNTVGGQIALSLKCNAHNMTYVHKGHSFEQALLDIELLDAPAGASFIIGGLDELTNSALKVVQAVDTQENWINEGAAFFLLSKNKTEHSFGTITAYNFQYHSTQANIEKWIFDFYNVHFGDGITADFCVLDGSYQQFATTIFADQEIINYKKNVGDYPTVSAVALALGIKKLQTINNVLIINQYQNYWSMYALKR